MGRSLRAMRGQASVELLFALPLVLIVMFAGWQIVVAGHTWWKVSEVARAATRAHYVAGQRGDQRAGIRRGREMADALLASSPQASRRIRVLRSGEVVVSARVPLVAPFRAALGADSGPRVSASSRMAP